jgi:hypothetical protein
MVVGMLLYFLSGLKLICIQSIIALMIRCYLCYILVWRPRDAMMLRTPEAEALLGIALIKGFGVSSIDGSPVPLGSTAINEPIEIPRSLGEVEVPR